MRKLSILFAMSMVAGGFSGCAAKTAEPEIPQVAHAFSIEPMNLPVIFNSAEDAQNTCDKNLANVDRLRGEIKAVSGKHTRENTLEPLNEIDISFDRIMGISELMANTHPEEAVRTAAEKCTERAAAVLTEIQMDPVLYAAVNDVDTSKLDAPSKRYVEKTLQS